MKTKKTKARTPTLREIIAWQERYIEFLQAAVHDAHRRCRELDDENWELMFGETKFESMRRG